MSVLSLINVGYKYPGQKTETLSDVSFNLQAGKALGIIGPNGGGKSTLLKIISGLIPNDKISGQILFNQQNISSSKSHTEMLTKMSFVPQTQKLNPLIDIPAKDYIQLAAKAANFSFNLDEFHELAQKLGIQKKLNQSLFTLSGGEKQRILLLKALLKKPALLMLDEPTKGLDGIGLDQLLHLLKNIQSTTRTAVVLVDHNLNQVIRHCDQILCLNRTSHWHDQKEFLTKNVLESIYHCEFEHLLIHENDKSSLHKVTDPLHEHLFCSHTTAHQHNHSNAVIFRKKK